VDDLIAEVKANAFIEVFTTAELEEFSGMW